MVVSALVSEHRSGVPGGGSCAVLHLQESVVPGRGSNGAEEVVSMGVMGGFARVQKPTVKQETRSNLNLNPIPTIPSRILSTHSGYHRARDSHSRPVLSHFVFSSSSGLPAEQTGESGSHPLSIRPA